MKALVFDTYGKAEDVLHLVEIAEPEPGPGEVKVRMLLSPINPSDIFNTIEGTYRTAVGRAIWNRGRCEDAYTIDPDGLRPLPTLPITPGLEGVGVVVKTGSGILARRLLGKRVTVVGGQRGNWQELNVVDAKQALPVHSALSDEQAAVSFVNPVTAYLMIREILKVRKGQFLLQSAGNSELGKMVVRLGRHFGFQTISIIRNGTQEPGLKAIGANHVIDISHQDLALEVHRITGGKGVPFAIDPIAGDLASAMVPCLGLHGRMLIYGTLSGEPLSFSSRDLMTPLASVEGFFLTNWFSAQGLLKKLMVTRSVAKLVRDGILSSDIRKVYPLESYRAAMADVRAEGNKGKVLLRMVGE